MISSSVGFVIIFVRIRSFDILCGRLSISITISFGNSFVSTDGRLSCPATFNATKGASLVSTNGTIDSCCIFLSDGCTIFVESILLSIKQFKLSVKLDELDELDE